MPKVILVLCLLASIANAQLWDQAKIEAAYKLLNGRYDREYIISIEMNRGKFKDAHALADWIEWGDR